MVSDKSNIIAQEILDALPGNYYVVHIKDRKILQSNDPNCTTKKVCFEAIFGCNKPCETSDKSCICEETLKLGENTEFQVSFKENEQTRYFKVRGALIKKDIALLSCEDEGQKIQQEKEIQFGIKRLERAEQLAHFGYWELDLNTQIFTTSFGGRIIYGIDTNNISVEEVRTFTLEEDELVFDLALNELTVQKNGLDVEYKIRRKNDGAVRKLRVIANIHKDSKLAYGILHDITEAARARKIKKEQEEYLHMLFQNMNSGFVQYKVIADDNNNVSDLIFLDLNPKYEEYVGIKKEFLLNKSIKEIFPSVNAAWIARYGEVALTGKPVTFTEYIEELDKHFEIAAYSPIRGYFATVLMNVTKRVQTENELKKAKKKAVESDHLKTQFLANMSHEIRTPLNGILGFTNLLIQDSTSTETRQYYGKIIENSGKRLMTVIDDIIDVSLIQSNQLQLDYREFNINDMLNDLFVNYQKSNADKLNRIKFDLQFANTREAELVYSDKVRVHQLLSNLLDNAFKFTESGQISFGIRNVDLHSFELFIKDTGIGIAKQKQRFIFDTFRQAEEGQARTYEGFGLGLAIVSGIIKNLKGSISLNSSPGKGSDFRITLPRNNHKIKSTKQKEAKNLTTIAGEKRRKIVSFEDEDVSIELLRTVIERQGHDIVNFVYAQKGIEYLRQNPVDLVLVDVQLPEMSGYEATRIIKNEFPDLPVIIQTAFAMSHDRESAFESGCDDFIAKPLTVDAIHNKLNKYFIETN